MCECKYILSDVICCYAKLNELCQKWAWFIIYELNVNVEKFLLQASGLLKIVRLFASDNIHVCVLIKSDAP